MADDFKLYYARLDVYSLRFQGECVDLLLTILICYCYWNTIMFVFTFQAGGIKLPRFSAMMLTSTQQLQMIIGIYINWYTWKELGKTLTLVF